MTTYRENRIKCVLLIYVPSSRYGNYYSFSENIFNHKFNSNFDKIFLYEEKTKQSHILN